MNPYLLAAIPLGPRIVQRILARFDAEDADTVFEEDRFTIREVIAHLADWEPLFRGRMELALAEPGAAIVTYDEGERAVERNYASLDVDVQFAIYAAEREKTVAFLKSLNRSDFRLEYIHPTLGPTVLEDQANMLLGHDLYHVEQLTAYLDAVGKR